ncbi:hypothetical protein P5V15_001503 [Pogonomyrmex californicus]
MPRPRYTNEELINMLLIYSECHKNTKMTAILYANHFPDKRHPTHALFGFLYRRLCQFGTLHASTRPRNVSQRAGGTINQVREVVLANRHTSTRCIAHEINISSTKIHNATMFPQDLPRRERFCDWISDQLILISCAIYLVLVCRFAKTTSLTWLIVPPARWDTFRGRVDA